MTRNSQGFVLRAENGLGLLDNVAILTRGHHEFI